MYINTPYFNFPKHFHHYSMIVRLEKRNLPPPAPVEAGHTTTRR
ncbi:hypothetical protein HMPREF0083_05933 [Aneurinibacillus aneurinilyticus ATCC 12856]|uniref:Uncharacterized protein n=1 Tax=Aneurinibacillus aneurinilyticus ATCC 12856 TaxID=649747 RepID=U1WQG4_ANEAE|nr:hypothetical protein HMPREF0083_05933 [Aneurinibacillus aneurinilyticus ATCC 12856]